jgi:hypothetical protein
MKLFTPTKVIFKDNPLKLNRLMKRPRIHGIIRKTVYISTGGIVKDAINNDFFFFSVSSLMVISPSKV